MASWMEAGSRVEGREEGRQMRALGSQRFKIKTSLPSLAP